MNLSKRLLSAAAFLFILTISVSAQRGERGPRGDREKSPEKMAERQTNRMTEGLDLTEAQAEKIMAINLMYAEKTLAAREEAKRKEELEREKVREALKPMRDAQEAELLSVLTPEQAEKFTAFMKEREEKGPRRGKGRKGEKGRKLRK
jgi:Spy/CpxP family protein refolding chaperone